MPPERSLIRRFIPPLLGKAMVIGFLILLLLIPLARMESLVDERVEMRQAAALRVAESSGGQQTTGAVLLAIPVDITRPVYGGSTRVERRVLHVLPDSLDISARVEPSYRQVGLYRTPIYLATVSAGGRFVARDFNVTGLPTDSELKWSEARLLILNSEARSLRAVDNLKLGGESPSISADGYAGMAGVSAALPAGAQDTGVIPFSFTLKLAGSDRLSFLPLARRAQVDLASPWPHPKFEGAPAPLDPQIGDQGFKARWSVLEINRDFAQNWLDDRIRDNLPVSLAFARSSVGVTFYEPVDVYQRSYRAVHYASLLICITFLTFFLWEHMSGIAIHAMQYLMVGLALALFYLLLLALSEHVAFDVAYGISAAALVALITVYLTGVLGRFALAVGAGAGLATLYTLLYWILRSEDYSLLMGALLLFGVLAVLMLATRRVDWTQLGRRGLDG